MCGRPEGIISNKRNDLVWDILTNIGLYPQM
jgi:hypothetical protein